MLGCAAVARAGTAQGTAMPGCASIARSGHGTELGDAGMHRKGPGKESALCWGTCDSLQAETQTGS